MQVSDKQAGNASRSDKVTKIMFVGVAVLALIAATVGLSYLWQKKDSISFNEAKEEEILEEAPDVKELDSALKGIASNIQSTFGPTNDVSEAVSSITDFPRFGTPEGSQIVGLNIHLSRPYEPINKESQLSVHSDVAFITAETDIDKLADFFQESITDEWGEKTVTDKTVTEDGETRNVKEIAYEEEDSSASFRIEIKVINDQAIVAVSHIETISSAQEIEALIDSYSFWSSGLPFPEGGEFESVTFNGGQNYIIGLDSPSAKDVSVEATYEYEGRIGDDELREKVEEAIKISEFSIEEEQSDVFVHIASNLLHEDSYFDSYAGVETYDVSFYTIVKS